MLENDDTRIIAEAEYTDRIRTVGADYLLCNMLVIFGGGAIAAAALRHGSEGSIIFMHVSSGRYCMAFV